MRRPGLLQGVGVALLLAACAGAVAAVALPLAGAGLAARAVVTLLGTAYLVYLLRLSRRRTGRATLFALWCAAAAGAWLFAPSFAAFAGVQVAALWLGRSLLLHDGILPALADLALNGVALALGAAALLRTGSLSFAAWSFFLVQAAFVLIPARLSRTRTAEPPPDLEAFERARRQADSALSRLISE